MMVVKLSQLGNFIHKRPRLLKVCKLELAMKTSLVLHPHC
jgi:hypothetical protein